MKKGSHGQLPRSFLPKLSSMCEVDGIEASREAFGLAEKEAQLHRRTTLPASTCLKGALVGQAMSEMQDLIKSRCRSCLAAHLVRLGN